MSEPYARMVDAVLRVLATHGFEGVSVRRVAALAGVSIGAVQHHFPTKDAMLGAAMDLVAARFQQHLSEAITDDMTAEAKLEALALSLLGVDDRDVTVTWLLRLARAAVDEATAERHRADWQAVADLLTRQIAAAAPDVDAPVAAAELLALLDGLACSVAVEPARVPAELAKSIAIAHVQRLLDGRAGRGQP